MDTVSESDFGFGIFELKQSGFLESDMIIQLGYSPNRIDITLSPSGVDFHICYSYRVVVDVAGVQVNFIDLENLKKNKKSYRQNTGSRRPGKSGITSKSTSFW